MSLTEKTKNGPINPTVQALIDNMEIIYWAQMEALVHGMLLQAVQKRLKEAALDE